MNATLIEFVAHLSEIQLERFALVRPEELSDQENVSRVIQTVRAVRAARVRTRTTKVGGKRKSKVNGAEHAATL